jgi:hypothetical protein
MSTTETVEFQKSQVEEEEEEEEEDEEGFNNDFN